MSIHSKRELWGGMMAMTKNLETSLKDKKSYNYNY